ncbi:hypothetical protein JNW88_01690, partial [Micromonospora sp. ATA32]|nr:hypothetical protein [Micromonospora sp. ATA32]
MNTNILRKSVLGVAGLAFAGGVVAGPMTAVAHANPVEGKPVAVAVQADKPGVDKAKLIPHG